MSARTNVWRRHLWWWLPALVFFLGSLLFVLTYRLVYAEQVAGLEQELEREEARLESLQDQAAELQGLVVTARTNQEALRELYVERFASERRRFTRATAEVRDLARRAGLDPSAISYPEEEIEDYGLVKRSFSFRVEGTYNDLREFINLLELTPSFITLEEINLSQGEEGERLAIDLTLSTLFAAEEILGPIERGELDPVAAARQVRNSGEGRR